MRRILIVVLVAVALAISAAPAMATGTTHQTTYRRHVHARGDDGDDDSYTYDEGCGRDGGGCNNRRRENYSGACSKYNCQNFDKSPVQDSFNLTICVMPGSCTPQNGKKEQQP
jgi:hypothetical protein